jgi:hypothetical protein
MEKPVNDISSTTPKQILMKLDIYDPNWSQSAEVGYFCLEVFLSG